MKYLAILSALIIFLLLTVIVVGLTEMSSINRVQQSEIDGLRARNKAEKDSLTNALTATRDSLQIAFETIKQANAERVEAHERSQKTIRDLRKIIFIQHTDSSRTATLKQLYPTFKP